ncbi:glutamate receptor 1-like isoform X1 [Vespula squamosa]|uniref:Glutamate receptor 1-like isoform X1 n=1 Tax=Vespula squamosa TaxID=30214 RepID=A0ABD2A0C1_VESSQ
MIIISNAYVYLIFCVIYYSFKLKLNFFITFVMPLKIFVLFLILFLPKTTKTYEFLSISKEQIPFAIDICKLYGRNSAILLYAESEKEMDTITMIFKWRRALSREGIATMNSRFSQMHESMYHIKQIVRPFYIVMISNYNAIKEFSLATSTLDMSSAMWLVIFMYKGDGSDYCHYPSEMLVRCGTENILREWYSIDTNRTEVNDVATWSLEGGITKVVPDSLYERRHNLQGLIMRAVVVKNSVFANLNKNGELSGIYGKIFRELCDTLNFSLEIVSKVDEYGRWNPTTKTWSGAIAEMYYGRADISFSGFTISNTRLNVVDFSLPILRSRNYLYIREPEIFAIKWSSYFLTFNYSVWIAIFGVLIVASILLIFFKIKNGAARKIGQLFSDNLLEIWGIFCQQGIADFSDKSSLRIVYFSVFILVTILWSAYSAALINYLISVFHVLPFDSLESFVADGTYQLVVFRGSSYYDQFANSEDPFAKKLMKLMLEEDKLPSTLLEGFRSVCENRNLAIYALDKMKMLIEHKITCNVVSVETGNSIYRRHQLPVRNQQVNSVNFNLSYVDISSRFRLQKFFENGMMNLFINSSFKKKSDDLIQYHPVPLISVISLLIFIQIGIVLSTFILIIEKFIFARKRKKMSMIHHIPKSYSKKNKQTLHKVTLILNTFVMPLKIFVLFLILFLPKTTKTYEFLSISKEQIPFAIDICKLYGRNSAILLYAESEKEMDTITMIFKWRRALSREGIATMNSRFSQMHESMYHIKQIVRPFYIVMISNYNAIKEFSLATSTLDMSSAMWLVIFMYKGDGSDYCHYPSEMLVRCGTENILREWYSIDTNRTEVNDVATWSLEGGITKVVPDSLYERRHNLQGLIMRAVVVKNSVFANLNKNGELSGICGEIFRELSVTLNFSFDIVSEVEVYGRRNPKENTWSGAIAELYAGHVDISFSGFIVTSARLNVVDFSLPIFSTKNYLYIREPEIFTIKWSSHFLAFTNSIWIALFGVLVVASIVLIFLKIENGTDHKIGHLLSDNFLEVWSIFCQQGIAEALTYCSFAEESSDRSSLRIAYFSVFLLVTVLSAAYSAALISFLTTVSGTLPFDSLESFVQDGTYQLAVIRGSAYYDNFANSEDPFAKKLMKLMLEEDKLPLTVLEGFISICENRHLAIYAFDEMEKSIVDKIPCNVLHFETGHLSNIAIVFSKHNPFTGVINYQLQKFFGNGILNRLKHSSFKKKSNDTIKHRPVSLLSVISLFIFIQIGILLSICILIIEKCIFARKRKKMIFFCIEQVNLITPACRTSYNSNHDNYDILLNEIIVNH